MVFLDQQFAQVVKFPSIYATWSLLQHVQEPAISPNTETNEAS